MQIDKSMIIDLIREKGNDSQAQEAEAQLPNQVDPVEQGGLLSKFGLDPQEILAKVGGGGEGAGGMLGNITKKF